MEEWKNVLRTNAVSTTDWPHLVLIYDATCMKLNLANQWYR